MHDLRNDIEKKQNELNQVSDKSSPAASALQNEIDQLKRKYRDFLDSLKKNKPPQPGEKEKAIALVAVETKTDGTLETGERPFVVMRLTDIKDPEKQEAIADLIGSSRVITLTDIANRDLNPGLRQLVSEAMTKEHVVLRSIVTEWKESVRTFLQEVARVGRPDPRLGYRAPGETRAIYCVEDSNFSPHMRSFLEWSVERNNGHPVVVLLPEFPEQISMSDLKGIAREFINSTGLSASDKKEIIDGIDKARSPQDIQRLMNNRFGMTAPSNFVKRKINEMPTEIDSSQGRYAIIPPATKEGALQRIDPNSRTILEMLNVLGELVHMQKMKEKAVEQVDYLLRIQAINNLQAQTAKDGITAAKSPQKLTACLGNVGGQTATIVANYWQKTEAETVERKRTEDGSRGRIDRLINEIKNKLNMLQENSGRVTLDDFKMAALEILEATNEEAKKSNGGMREQNFTELCGQIKNARNAEEVT